MKTRLITIAMRQYISIEQICDLVDECYISYETLIVQDQITKLNHILFLISLVEEEEIYRLSQKEAQRYKKAIDWVWFKLREIGNEIVADNFKIIDNKFNEEEDLSKLSKEELIARLKEATK